MSTEFAYGIFSSLNDIDRDGEDDLVGIFLAPTRDSVVAGLGAPRCQNSCRPDRKYHQGVYMRRRNGEIRTGFQG